MPHRVSSGEIKKITELLLCTLLFIFSEIQGGLHSLLETLQNPDL